MQKTMQQRSKDTGRDFGCRFIDGDDAAAMETLVTIVIGGQDLCFWLNHQPAILGALELFLALQSNMNIRDESVGVPLAVEPATYKLRTATICKTRFKQPRTTAKPGHFRAHNAGENHCLFSRREFRYSLDVPAIFIPKRGIVKQIRDGEQPFCRKHLGAGGPNALYVLKRRIQVQRTRLMLHRDIRHTFAFLVLLFHHA